MILFKKCENTSTSLHLLLGENCSPIKTRTIFSVNFFSKLSRKYEYRGSGSVLVEDFKTIFNIGRMTSKQRNFCRGLRNFYKMSIGIFVGCFISTYYCGYFYIFVNIVFVIHTIYNNSTLCFGNFYFANGQITRFTAPLVETVGYCFEFCSFLTKSSRAPSYVAVFSHFFSAPHRAIRQLRSVCRGIEFHSVTYVFLVRRSK